MAKELIKKSGLVVSVEEKKKKRMPGLAVELSGRGHQKAASRDNSALMINVTIISSVICLTIGINFLFLSHVTTVTLL